MISECRRILTERYSFGCNDGFLKSASICANGPAFEGAINEILPGVPEFRTWGIHLNIMEGRALSNFPDITDNLGNFNCGYLGLIRKSKDKEFLNRLEKEFRAQIEKVINIAQVDHIDSHVHTHAIPADI